MAKKIIVTGRFNANFPYIDDRGVERFAAVKYAPPKNITDTASVDQLAAIMAAGGAQVYKVGATVITDIGNLPSTESGNFIPRRLRFIFSDNGSLSVPVANTSNIVQTANSIITNITAVLPSGVRLVRIQELGERFLNILAEFNNAAFTGNPVAPINASRYYSGTASYQTSVANRQVILPFRILSEDPSEPPDNLADPWGTCVGALSQSNFGCGGNSRRFDHRRYTPQYVVTANGGGSQNTVESHEFPVTGRESTQITACGGEIVDALGGSLFCMSYSGNSDNQFHLNPGITLS